MLYTGVAGLGIAATAVAFNDDAKHIAGAAQRTGRVVGTLFVNINEYASMISTRNEQIMLIGDIAIELLSKTTIDSSSKPATNDVPNEHW